MFNTQEYLQTLVLEYLCTVMELIPQAFPYISVDSLTPTVSYTRGQMTVEFNAISRELIDQRIKRQIFSFIKSEMDMRLPILICYSTVIGGLKIKDNKKTSCVGFYFYI